MIVWSFPFRRPTTGSAAAAARIQRQARSRDNARSSFTRQLTKLVVLCTGVVVSLMSSIAMAADEATELKNLGTLVGFVQQLPPKAKTESNVYCSAHLFLISQRPGISENVVNLGETNIKLIPKNSIANSPEQLQDAANELRRSWEVVKVLLERAVKDRTFHEELNTAGWSVDPDKIAENSKLKLEPVEAKTFANKLEKPEAAPAIELLNRALNHAYNQEKILAKALPEEIRSRAVDLLLARLKDKKIVGREKAKQVEETDAKLAKVVEPILSNSSVDPTPRSLLAEAFERWGKDGHDTPDIISTYEGLEDAFVSQHEGMPETLREILNGVAERNGLNTDLQSKLIESEKKVRDLTDMAGRTAAMIDQLHREKLSLQTNFQTLAEEKKAVEDQKKVLEGTNATLQSTLGDKDVALQKATDELIKLRRPGDGGDNPGAGEKKESGQPLPQPQSVADRTLNLLIGGVGLSLAVLVGLAMYFTQVRPLQKRARQIGENAHELLGKLKEAETQLEDQIDKFNRMKTDPGSRERQLLKEKNKLEQELTELQRNTERQLSNHPAARALEAEQKRTEGFKEQVSLLQAQITTLSNESRGHLNALQQLQILADQQWTQIQRHEGTITDFKNQLVGLNNQIGQRDARIREQEEKLTHLAHQLQVAVHEVQEKEDYILKIEKSLLPTFLQPFVELLHLLRSDSPEWSTLRGRFEVLNGLLKCEDKALFLDELKVLGRSVQQLYRKVGAPEEASKELVVALTAWAKGTFPDLKIELPDIGEKFDDNRMINLSRQRGSEVSSVASWLIWEGAQRKFASEVETTL